MAVSNITIKNIEYMCIYRTWFPLKNEQLILWSTEVKQKGAETRSKCRFVNVMKDFCP